MVELVVLPNGPASGKKPAAPPPPNKRLSIKDYFTVAEPSSASDSSPSTSIKKRKSTSEAPAPIKKARKPSLSVMPKKGPTVEAGPSRSMQSQMSDKENTDASKDTSAQLTDYPATEMEDNKTDVPLMIKARKELAKPGEGVKKTKVVKKKTNADLGTADKVVVAQSTSTREVPKNPFTLSFKAPGFKAINAPDTPEKVVRSEAEPPAETETEAPSDVEATDAPSEVELTTDVNGLPKVVKAKKVTKAKDPKIPKAPKIKKEKVSKGLKEPKGKKEKVPKLSKEPKAPKIQDPPKELKEAMEPKKKKVKEPKPTKPIESEDKAPRAEKAQKAKKEKVPKNPAEIQGWKAYEPNKLGKVSQYFQPAPSIPQPPKPVDPPPFEHIEISYPHSLILDRIIVREFVLRFEKALKLLHKYINIVNNPNSDWTDLTYRAIFLSLLRIIASDDNCPVPYQDIDAGIKELEKTPADDPKIWTCLSSIVEGFIDTSQFTDFTTHKDRLGLLVRLIVIATSSTIVRSKIEEDAAMLKKEEKEINEAIKKIKADWDVLKAEKAKQRFTVPAEDMPIFEARFAEEQALMRQQIAIQESCIWFKRRKLCPRERPMGVDALGNTYWLYIQRDRQNEDWGRWIVVEKSPDLPHPSGILPPPKPEEFPSEPDEDVCAPDTPAVQPSGVSDAERRRRVWYALSTSEEATQLAKWIRYSAEKVFYEQALSKNASASSGSQSPTRQRLQAVELPMSPSMRNLMKTDPKKAGQLFAVKEAEKIHPKDLVTRKSIDELCNAVLKIGAFWKLEEEGVGNGRLPV